MIKDITIGQYFPGKTFVHELDARVKILLTLVYIIVIFFIESFYGYGLIFLTIIAITVISKIPVSYLAKGLKPLWVIISLTLIINIFFTPGKNEILSVWRLSITEEGLETGILMALRLVLLVLGTSLLTLTTSPLTLTDGIENLLSPLKVIKFPAHELAMMMTIALRFIPTLLEETDKIMKAQKARGADFETGNIFERAKALVPLLVPLFISAFRRADELALAMEARCYRGGEGRTRMKALKMTAKDVVTLIGVTGLFVAIIFIL